VLTDALAHTARKTKQMIIFDFIAGRFNVRHAVL